MPSCLLDSRSFCQFSQCVSDSDIKFSGPTSLYLCRFGGNQLGASLRFYFSYRIKIRAITPVFNPVFSTSSSGLTRSSLVNFFDFPLKVLFIYWAKRDSSSNLKMLVDRLSKFKKNHTTICACEMPLRPRVGRQCGILVRPGSRNRKSSGLVTVHGIFLPSCGVVGGWLLEILSVIVVAVNGWNMQSVSEWHTPCFLPGIL